jgi:hypothetical protein
MIVADFSSLGYEHFGFNVSILRMLVKRYHIKKIYLCRSQYCILNEGDLSAFTSPLPVNLKAERRRNLQFINITLNICYLYLLCFFSTKKLLILNIHPLFLFFARLLGTVFFVQTAFLAHSFYDDLAIIYRESKGQLSIRDKFYDVSLINFPSPSFMVVFIGFHIDKKMASRLISKSSCSFIPFPFYEYNKMVHPYMVGNRNLESTFQMRDLTIGCPGFKAKQFIYEISNFQSLQQAYPCKNAPPIILFGAQAKSQLFYLSSNTYTDVNNECNSYYEQLNACDLIIIPSWTSNPYRYSFSAILADLLAFEKPFVSVRNSLLDYYEGRHGKFYFEIFGVESLMQLLSSSEAIIYSFKLFRHRLRLVAADLKASSWSSHRFDVF